MSRRSVGIAAALAVVLLVLVPAGTLSGVFASDVTSSGLVIEKGDGPNGAYAKLSNEELALDLSEGVSNNAVTRIDAVFTVTNDRSYSAPVWLTDETDALTFYNTATGNSVEGESNNVSLAPGETLVVGVRVDTTQTNVSELESMDSFTVETMVKDATVTASNTTATPTATASGNPDSDSPPGGGGQSGGGSSASIEVVDTAEGATINIHDASSGERLEAPLQGGSTDYVAGSGITVDRYTLQLYFSNDRFRIEVTDPTDSPQQASELQKADALGYFRLENYHVEQAGLEDGNLTFTVDSLPSGADPSDVVLYRKTGSGWKRVETTRVDGTTYTADADGFGEFAVAVDTSSDGDRGGDDGTDETTDQTVTANSATDENRGPVTTATATPAGTPAETPPAQRRQLLDAPHVTLTSGIALPTVFVLALFTLALAARVHRR